jgi:hypothetical protein
METASSAAGEEESQPVTAPDHIEAPADNSAIEDLLATMPTDEFGRELTSCQLPWDYLPKKGEVIESLEIIGPSDISMGR